jgi:hypothetical protein
MITHCLELHVQSLLNATPIITTTFDLWMSKGQQDTFVLIVHFLSTNWKPHHVIVGLFKPNDTMGVGLARQLKTMPEKFGLISKVLCYVKDKGTNLANMTTTLKSIISCEALSLLVFFDGAHFGHGMNKTTQYATNDDKISKDLVPISVKFAQASLQSCIIWPKKSSMLTI